MRVLVSVLLLFLSGTAIAKQCLGITLQGGGDKGAYEVGVLKGFLEQIPDKIQYDVASGRWSLNKGVSVGSLNSIGFAVYKKGDEAAMVQYLEDLWTDISAGDVYEAWPGILGILRGFFDKPSLFNTEPLRQFLKKEVQEKGFSLIGRPTIATSVNANTGEYKPFPSTGKTTDQFLEEVLASASIPAAFPPTYIDGEPYIDGGSVRNLNIEDAINWCKSQGFQEKEIVIDSLLCDNQTISKVDNSNKNALQMLLRYNEIQSYWSALHYIEDVKHFHPEVTIRYVVGPSKPLPTGLLPIRFNKESTLEMIQIGLDDAKAKIAEGEGVYAEAVHRMFEEMKHDRHNFRKPEEIVHEVRKEWGME